MVIFLLALVILAILFPNFTRSLIGLALALLCFAIAAGLEPDSASNDHRMEQR